ncbi:MAG: hypothetical protein ABI442_15340 [Gemmatimonadaceae bacterium]
MITEREHPRKPEFDTNACRTGIDEIVAPTLPTAPRIQPSKSDAATAPAH